MVDINSQIKQHFKGAHYLTQSFVTSLVSTTAPTLSVVASYNDYIPDGVIRDILLQNVGSASCFVICGLSENGAITATTTCTRLASGESLSFNDVKYDLIAYVHEGGTATTLTITALAGA